MGNDCLIISESDLFGRFFLKKPNGDRFANYFNTIEELRPLFDSKEWNECVTGYYINVTGNLDAVRLSYFTVDSPKAIKCKNDFCLGHNVLEIKPFELPFETRISEGYGGEELRFRRFLNMYTKVGLDLLKADLMNARYLFATFRLQIMRSRQTYKSHFEGTFEKHSLTYSTLSAEDKEGFMNDLSNWPNPPQVDWAHMMVNMILPGDFVPSWHDFLSPKPAMTVEEINRILVPMNFQIPADWSPMKNKIT